jgi:hypothetical protein
MDGNFGSLTLKIWRSNIASFLWRTQMEIGGELGKGDNQIDNWTWLSGYYLCPLIWTCHLHSLLPNRRCDSFWSMMFKPRIGCYFRANIPLLASIWDQFLLLGFAWICSRFRIYDLLSNSTRFSVRNLWQSVHRTLRVFSLYPWQR